MKQPQGQPAAVVATAIALAALLLAAAGCSGPSGDTLTLTLGDAAITLAQGDTGAVTVTISGASDPATLTLEGAPPGVTAAFDPPSAAATSTLTLTVDATAPDGEAGLTVRASDGAKEAEAALTLTVTAGPGSPGNPQPDTTPPAVVSTEATSNRTVVIVFSEAVVNADDPADYQIIPDLAVEGVSVAADGKTVTLSTAPQVENQAYAVLIQGVTDASGNAYQPGANPNDTSFSGAGQVSGVLSVVVTGLPAGVDADVTASGPGGFSQTLTGSADLSVPSGTYQFTVSPVTPDSATFAGASGNPGEIAFDAGAGDTVTLAYACTAVNPPDPNLHAALQDATGKSEYACADLAALTGLTAINKGVAGLEGLQYAVGLTILILDDNQLASLPDDAFDSLTNLTGLSLIDNQLASLPPGVFDSLTTLGGLHLDDNQLASLPPGVFDSLTNLTGLGLNDNQLASLPPGVFDSLTKLNVLYLHNNQLASLPPGVFDSLTELQNLSLHSNALAALPLGMFDSLTLAHFNVSSNCLQPAKVPTKGQLAALRARTSNSFSDANNPGAGCLYLPPQPPTHSTFDEGVENWWLTNDGVNLRHVPTGGQPGGYLAADDGSQGTIWYWKAPDLYYGDASDYFGKSLTFFRKQSATDSPITAAAADVILRNSAGTSLELATTLDPPGTDWGLYAVLVNLHPDSFTPTLSEQAFRDFLADLTSLEIRGEFRNGADTGGLDTVSFGVP